MIEPFHNLTCTFSSYRYADFAATELRLAVLGSSGQPGDFKVGCTAAGHFVHTDEGFIAGCAQQESISQATQQTILTSKASCLHATCICENNSLIAPDLQQYDVKVSAQHDAGHLLSSG